MMRKALAAAAVIALGACGVAFADSGTEGAAFDAPGVLSGNVLQVPIHVPIDICGDSIDILGLLNPTGWNVCLNR